MSWLELAMAFSTGVVCGGATIGYMMASFTWPDTEDPNA